MTADGTAPPRLQPVVIGDAADAACGTNAASRLHHRAIAESISAIAMIGNNTIHD
jgi:hypothetical protein